MNPKSSSSDFTVKNNILIEMIQSKKIVTKKEIALQGWHDIMEALFFCAMNNVEVPESTFNVIIERFSNESWDWNQAFQSYGTNLLYAACENGHVGIVREMIKLGADLNYSGSDCPRNVPLLVACRNNHVEIANLLLDNGASLELFDNENDLELNFLHEAFVGGNLKLIDRIICMKSKDQHENLDIIDRIIKLGSELKGDGYTMLHAACAAGNLRLFNLFIERGLDIHAKYKNSFSTVHCAVAGGNEKILKILMEKEVDYSSCPSTLLHVAAKYDQLDMLKNLIKSGKFDIDAVDNNGNTAFHFACGLPNCDLALFLMNSGANIESVDHKGRSAIDFAGSVSSFHEPIIFHPRLFIKTWFWACKNNFDLASKMMFRPEMRGKLSVQDERGRTGLFYIIENLDKNPFDDYFEISPYDFDISIRDNEGRNVHHIACISGKLGFMDLLHYSGDWNVPDNYGNTLLHNASKYGNHQCFDYLFDEDLADVSATNNEGKTALHLAAENGHLEAVKYLIAEGADIDTIDNDGNTPIDLAKLNNFDINFDDV